MSYSFVRCLLFLGLLFPVFCSQSDDSVNKSPITTTTTMKTSTEIQSSTQSLIQPTTTASVLHNDTKFVLTKGNGSVCALVSGTFQLSINYKNKTGADLTNTLYIDSSLGSLTVEGSCGEKEQNLTVDFYNGWTFSFIFMRDSTETDANYYTKYLTLFYQVDSLHGFSNPSTPGPVFSEYTESDLYTVKNGQNYLCKAKKTLTFNDTVTTLTVTGLQLQAFKPNPSSTEFDGDIKECLADNASDSNLVPIIVGVCLAALVIVILVAYFIGRWRTSRDPAYQPV